MESYGYSRVSSSEQELDKGALKKQIERLRDAGCSKVYWDIQSRTTESREGLEQMIRDISALPKGAITSVVFTRLDRIGSSSKLFYSLLEILREKNIKLQGLDQSIDPDTLGGELTIDMLLAAAKFEVRMTTERLRAERKQRKSQGKSHRIAPFGYKVEGDRYVKNEDPCICLISDKKEFTVWEVARYIFEIFSKVNSIAGTCRKFHEEFGISIKKAAKWEAKSSFPHLITSADNLSEIAFLPQENLAPFRYPYTGLGFSITGMRNLLTNPIYAGGTLHDSYQKTKLSKSRNRKHFDEWDAMWGTHDDAAIITFQEHELIKKIIRNNRNDRWATQSEKIINPFSRLVSCFCCGASYTRHAKRTNKDGTTYHYYQCRQHRNGGCENSIMIKSDKLESQTIKYLTQEAERLLSTIGSEEPYEEPRELVELRKSLADLEKMSNLPAIEKAKDEIRQQIKSFSLTSNRSMPPESFIDSFIDLNFWRNLEPSDKRRAMQECVKRIVVNSGEVVRVDFLW